MMEHLSIRIDKQREIVIVRHEIHGGEQVFLVHNIKRLTYSFVKAWTEALKSGKYNQTNGGLAFSEHGEYGYCCLGIAAICRGYSVKTIEGIGHLHNDNVRDSLVKLPKVMRESGNINNAFAALNDDMNLNFEEIAYVVKEMYKKVNLLDGD